MKITVATSINYGNYKFLKPRVVDVTQLIYRFWPRLTDEFKFSPDIRIHIRPIKGNTSGIAFNFQNKIEIDPRYSQEYILETLAHELTHSEQYYQNRLTSSIVNYNRVWHWGGETYREPKSYNEYYNSPWEIEARERSHKFIKENRI